MPDHRQLVLDIYDTVADPSLWPGVLERVAHATGARGSIIFRLDANADGAQLSASHMTPNYDPDDMARYLQRFQALELEDQKHFGRHSRMSDAIELVDDSVLTTNAERLERRENTEFLRQLGVTQRAGALLDKDDPTRHRFSLQFGVEHGPFNTADRAVAHELLPHLAKALDLGRPVARLSQGREALALALDNLRIGVCVLDARGRTVAENTEFVRQREETGAFRARHDGGLRLADDSDDRRLAELIEDALAHGRFGARPRKEAVVTGRPTPDGTSAMVCIEVAPLARAPAIGAPELRGCVIYSIDTSRPVPIDTQMVAQVFSLTNAEADIVGLLGDGLTNAEIAERRGRSTGTVSGQVKTILAKMNCANRTQLVRLASTIGGGLLLPMEGTQISGATVHHGAARAG